MESPISNWVLLPPGVKKVLHLTDHRVVDRVITVPETGREKSVQSLEFDVDFEDGIAVSKSFSVVSQKLAAELNPYLLGDRYKHFGFTFLKPSPGRIPPRLVLVEPWTRS
uniref:Uncharacterized protein n=1 Tax=viral metagenome TaxID=1070528 RepID=A0A6H2A6E1_9ZZZZ